MHSAEYVPNEYRPIAKMKKKDIDELYGVRSISR
jgi:hypothetical protein